MTSLAHDLILFPDASLPKPDYEYFPKFCNRESAEAVFSYLINETPWKTEKIKIFGKEVAEPRLVAFYGERTYKYSGKVNVPLPFTPLLVEIKNKIENLIQTKFNVVLLNYYRNGSDSMGWHSDNEPELGQNPTIASLTLGAERVFEFKYLPNSKIRHKLLLENGSLLIMQGNTQHLWQHQIAKSKKIISPRINLTFRQII